MTLTLVLKATLILCLAAAANGLLLRRRASAAQRHLVWMLAFVSLLALPWMPVLWRPHTGPVAAIFAAASGGARSAGGWLSLTWLRWVWLAGAAAALLRLALAHVRLARTAAEVPMAMTWGILRPRILAPEGDLHQFDRQHEEAHIARRDGLWQFVAQLACAAYWFHPLVWWAERRAACERERACDDLVLGSGADPADYAQRLVDAARLLASPPLAALAVSGESGLADRVKAILDPALNRRTLRLRDFACGLVFALLMLAPLAPIAAQQQQQPTGPAYPGDAVDFKPQLVYKIEPEYSEEARKAKIDGPVHVTAVVTAEGAFTNVEVVNGLGYGLDEKAIEAIEQWRATPALKDGVPVDCQVKVEVNFRLM